ncbi:hypothetical protein V1478_005171 [Vespula squamosa]|uniref:Uncharacterized protein n=1 Tax=Vespula squamosa TaxID=30214 RepID=A0ABD2BE42_VESSQ
MSSKDDYEATFEKLSDTPRRKKRRRSRKIKFLRDKEILSTFDLIEADFDLEKLIEKYVEYGGMAIR